MDELTEKFRLEVYNRAGLLDPNNDLCWYSLTVGFALGNGLSPDAAHEFATHIRYHTELG
jgi:hypothetical protein